jgi:Fe2+ transport system protein FeoA
MSIATKEMLLQQLRPGQLAEIVGFQGSDHEIARLTEMGLRKGGIVSVSRGGITCIVHLLNGSRLCIRPSRALMILVEPICESFSDR